MYCCFTQILHPARESGGMSDGYFEVLRSCGEVWPDLRTVQLFIFLTQTPIVLILVAVI